MQQILGGKSQPTPDVDMVDCKHEGFSDLAVSAWEFHSFFKPQEIECLLACIKRSIKWEITGKKNLLSFFCLPQAKYMS